MQHNESTLAADAEHEGRGVPERPAPGRGWRSRLRTGLLAALLWCSGFCGISYEILYGRLLGNLLGDQFGVSAAILLTFLLGIGVGTLYAHRLARWLWAIELGIGLCGAGAALMFRPLNALLYGPLGWQVSGLGGAMLVSVILLIVPTLLIGATLPLFAGCLNRVTARPLFAYTYMVYNFGAAITALAIEYWLVRRVGLQHATLCVAGLNFIVATGLFLGFRDFWRKPPAPAARAGSPRPAPWPAWNLLAGLALASVASAIFQLTMIKVAEGFLGPFRETFALVLSLTLLGIAVGAVIARRMRCSFAEVMWVALAGLAWLMWQQENLLEGYAAAYPEAVKSATALLVLKLKTLAWLMGVPAVAFGATIPALLAREDAVARDSGRLLFVSSVANAAGFLLMAFVLHERFDYGVILMIVIGLAGLAAAVHRGLHWRALPPVAVTAVILVWPARQWIEPLIYLGYDKFHSSAELKETREEFENTEVFKGKQDNFAITWFDGHPFLLINGYRSIALDSEWEKVVGGITSSLAPKLDRALVLGLGAGATANTVGLLFDHTDVVEINPVLVKNLFRLKEYNFDIEQNPRVKIILDDGIHFVRVTPNRYSLILNTVTSPLYFSSSKLYTVDFLEDVKARLTPDGIYMTWLDSRVGEQGADIILATLQRVFRHCRLAYVRSGYYLLIASDQPPRAFQADAALQQPILRRYFFDECELHPAWLAYSVINLDAYRLIGETNAPLNTLDLPTLEFEMARLRERGFSRFRGRVGAQVEPGHMKNQLSAGAFQWRADRFVAHADLMLGEGNWLAKAIRRATGTVLPDADDRIDLAMADFYTDRAAVTRDADDHHWAGIWSRRGGDYQRAIQEYQRTLEMDPRHDNTWYNLGICYEGLGDWDAAFEHFAKELTVDPRDEDVPLWLGRLRHRQGRFAEAIPWLTQAIALDDADTEARLLRAEAYEKTGNLEAAAADYAAAAEGEDEFEDATAGLLRVGRALGARAERDSADLTGRQPAGGTSGR